MRMSKYVLTILLILSGYALTAQVYNPIPQYVFRNKLGVGRNTPVDQAAYMNIGPNGGANQGVVLPRVADTLSILGTKRHGLLIFSRQLNKFAWWDSTGNKWTEVGSGSGSSGEVMLMNGSQTVGDSLLMPSVSGDSAFIKNLLAGNAMTIVKQGDTVLQFNAQNIGNTDLRVTGTNERWLYVGEDTSFIIGPPDQSNVDFQVFNDGNLSGILAVSREKNTAYSSLAVESNRAPRDSVATIELYVTTGAYYAHNNGPYGDCNITIDTTGIRMNGIIYGDVSTYSNLANQNLNLRATNHVLYDLTGAASRTIRLHPKPSGAIIRIVNQSSDAVNKWSFTGSTVYEKNGSTVTTLDDHTCYELMYMTSGISQFGEGWHIIKKY